MATFWTGSSVTFTNGQKVATVGTGDDISSIYPNSVAVINGVPYEVAKAYNDGSSKIELEKAWPLSSSSNAVVIFPSAAAAAKAGQTAQTLMSAVSGLVNSASATATGNSFAKRDANGRLKAADASAASDLVTKGQFQSLETYASHGLGVTTDNNPVADLNAISATSIRRYNSDTANIPNAESAYGSVITMCRSSSEATQIAVDLYGAAASRGKSSGVWGAWRKQLDSLNTNLNEFGGLRTGDLICPTIGFSENGGVVSFLLPISSKTTPTGITVSGGFRLFNVEAGTYETAPQIPTINSALSSNKDAYISFSGTSSTTRGKLYLLASSTSSIGKIKVNY